MPKKVKRRAVTNQKISKMKVRSHKAKRGNKVVTVREHTKGRFRSVNSSFINRISENPDGGYVVTIKGRDYPDPLLPNEKVGGLISGGGRYYNSGIRGRYF